MPRRTVFLDRDGVLNAKAADDDYIRSWEQFRFLDGVVEALSLLQSQGYRLIVVTNQRGVARGLMSAADVESIHREMRRALAEAGVSLDAVYYCPHEKGLCQCRKPAPGMLLQAMADFPDTAPETSWMVGDSLSDMEAGARAGCRNILIAQGSKAEALLRQAAEYQVPIAGTAASLASAVSKYL